MHNIWSTDFFVLNFSQTSKTKPMKSAFSALVVLFLLASCAKYKEKRAWKEWYGTYTLSTDIQLYDDFNGDPVFANQLSINKYGISFSHTDGTQPSCVFSKMDESSIPGYDYQLIFKEIRLYVFGSESGQLVSPSETALNQDREFLFKRVDDSKIIFRIQNDGQLIDNVGCNLN